MNSNPWTELRRVVELNMLPTGYPLLRAAIAAVRDLPAPAPAEQVAALRRVAEEVLDTATCGDDIMRHAKAALAGTPAPEPVKEDKPLGALPTKLPGGGILYVESADGFNDLVFPRRVTLAMTGDMGRGSRLVYAPNDADETDVATLRAQVEALTKERDDALAKLAAKPEQKEPEFRAILCTVHRRDWCHFAECRTVDEAKRIVAALNAAGGGK